MNTQTEALKQESGHPKVFDVIVNGRARKVEGKELTFVEVVQLAFDDAVFNATVVYTVTYKRGEGHKPEGSLVQGDTVKVKEGMIFNVIRSDKS